MFLPTNDECWYSTSVKLTFLQKASFNSHFNNSNKNTDDYGSPYRRPWNRRENIGVTQTVTACQEQTAGLTSELSDVSMDLTSCFLLLVSTANRLVLFLLWAVRMMMLEHPPLWRMFESLGCCSETPAFLLLSLLSLTLLLKTHFYRLTLIWPLFIIL